MTIDGLIACYPGFDIIYLLRNIAFLSTCYGILKKYLAENTDNPVDLTMGRRPCPGWEIKTRLTLRMLIC
jgi:hypothetical protein